MLYLSTGRGCVLFYFTPIRLLQSIQVLLLLLDIFSDAVRLKSAILNISDMCQGVS